MHENRETSAAPVVKLGSRSAGEGNSRTARAYVSEESHGGIVPVNHSNKDGRPLAESGEGRPPIKENVRQPNTNPTQSGKGVSQGLPGVRKAAREHKEMKFTALLHHLTIALLRESFYGQRLSVDGGPAKVQMLISQDPNIKYVSLDRPLKGAMNYAVPAVNADVAHNLVVIEDISGRCSGGINQVALGTAIKNHSVYQYHFLPAAFSNGTGAGNVFQTVIIRCPRTCTHMQASRNLWVVSESSTIRNFEISRRNNRRTNCVRYTMSCASSGEPTDVANAGQASW
jgi:hypothetical protein